jgi:hypothetical protein
LKRLLQDIKKYRWFLLVGFGVLVAGRWFYNRGKPERIMDLERLPQSIKDGTVYTLHRNPLNYEVTINAVSADNGSVKSLAKEDIAEWDVHNVAVHGDTIRYIRSYRPMERGTLRPSAAQPSGIGSPTPGAARARPAPRLPIIKTMPKGGGTPREFPIRPPSSTFEIVGDTMYWIDYKPDDVKQIKEGGENIEVHYPRSDVVLTPLGGGPERRFTDVALRSTRLMPVENAVYWSVTRPDVDGEVDVYRASPNDTKPAVLTHFKGNPPPTELAGRIYWIEVNNSEKPGAPPPEIVIVSAKSDGSDKQILYKLVTRRSDTGVLEWNVTQLNAYGGRLYALVSKSADRSLVVGKRPATLYQFIPGKSKELEKVYDFPEHVAMNNPFDNGYYYYTVVEERENMFDFTSSGLYLRRVPTLYRYHLPN